MREQRGTGPFWLLYAAGVFGLGLWFISDDMLGPGIAWWAVGVAHVLIWLARRGQGPTPWWARSVSWADVQSRRRGPATALKSDNPQRAVDHG